MTVTEMEDLLAELYVCRENAEDRDEYSYYDKKIYRLELTLYNLRMM